ncbi:MAG: type II secretion system secretin GspD [Pseudomonadota bacterium]
MKHNIVLGTAFAVLISGCSEFSYLTEDGPMTLRDWQARNLLGTGDGTRSERFEGRVTGGRMVEAGTGTIYPGRTPLFRETDFRNSDGERTVSLNLVNVSIADAAAAILGELLRVNYVIDPAVQGTVNIRSSQPISRTTAIEVFELALKQNNAAIVRRGDAFAVVPLSADLSIGASTGRDVPVGYSIRVIPLQHIGSQEMATILQPFAGSGIVGIDAQRNVIVLAGTSADQRAWQETIDSFDVNWLANRSVGIFPIRGRSAQSIVSGLELLVETEEEFEPIVAFEVIPENNSILAVAKTPQALKSVSTWIMRLTKEGANDAQVYSYDMKYARASSISATLSSILGVSVESDNSADEAQVIQASVDAEAQGGDMNATRIVANEATNTLLIHATHAEYQRVLGILHRLDVPPRQVSVEATIVEVTLNDALRYGVQYFFEEGDNEFSLTRSTNSTAIASEVPGFNAVFDVANPNVIVDALEDVTSVNVVSSPNLMILNNEPARLVVGDQVPISVQTSQDATDSPDVFISTVEFRDTGVIFEVTPRINSSGSVVLDIVQEVSTVGETDASTGNPIISQRQLSSSISVDSGETIALGGLFDQRKTRGSAGLPGLARNSPFGGLFGRKSGSDVQTELLVLITPRIVNDSMDARRVTRSLRNRMQNIRMDDQTLRNNTGIQQMGSSTTFERPQVTQPAAAVPSNSDVVSRAAAPAATTVASTAPGTHFVYLGAFSSKDRAQAHWSTVSSKHSSLLNTLAPRFAKNGELTAVAVGPVSERRADAICGAVADGCFKSRAN